MWGSPLEFGFERGRGIGCGEGKAMQLRRAVIHAHRAIEHLVRIVEGVADEENVDGKTVTLVAPLDCRRLSCAELFRGKMPL
jgi:hypothetical protein